MAGNHNSGKNIFLEAKRRRVDEIDDQILDLLFQRMKLSEEIAIIKANNDFPSKNPAREREVILKIRKKAEGLELEPLFINKVWNLIISQSNRIQEKLRRDIIAGRHK